MRSRSLIYGSLALSGILLAGGLIFLCAASARPGRLPIAIVLVLLGGALAAWAGISLGRMRAWEPSQVADRIVELVRRRGEEEITLADAAGSLHVPLEVAEAGMGLLTDRQLARRERRADRDVFVFPQLRTSKISRRCPFCGSEFSVKMAMHKCPNCGASLELTKQ